MLIYSVKVSTNAVDEMRRSLPYLVARIRGGVSTANGCGISGRSLYRRVYYSPREGNSLGRQSSRTTLELDLGARGIILRGADSVKGEDLVSDEVFTIGNVVWDLERVFQAAERE